MKSCLFATIIAAAIACYVPDAWATTMVEEKFKCPVGGEKFKAPVILSYSSFGQRPDGRPYGSLPVFPIPECPGNGFLLFRDDFTRKELAILTSLVAGTEYQAMRSVETPHYRAWWLAEHLPHEPYDTIGLLYQAALETDDAPDRKARYQSDFFAAATALPASEEHRDDWFWFNARAANALRELGSFDKAATLLAQVASDDRLPVDEETRDSAQQYLAALGRLVEERNPVSEPANLIPPDFAAVRCVVPLLPLTAVEAAACASADVLGAIEAFEYTTEGGADLSGEAAIRAMSEAQRGGSPV